MHWIDWTIVAGLLVFIVGAALTTNKYTKSVADFLAANRSAGRYLLCISSGIAGLGAISVVARFEMYYRAGFTATWWDVMMAAPVLVLMALSGLVVYRFRETRALTLAQFLEARYSRNFRVFAGIVLWVSGVVNFGIFPAVGARFFIYFCGLPETVPVLGISMFAVLMAALLAISLFFVFIGGQVAVMITDFFQGVFTNIVFLIILVPLFFLFDWSTLIETLKTAPEDASMIHPFHSGQIEGFNPWFFFIAVVTLVYGCRAWQGSQAYNSSARSAHEAKMAAILGEWRTFIFMLLMVLLPVGAYVVMHNPQYGHIATEVNAGIEHIGQVLEPEQAKTIQKQMTVPLALAHMLPVGIVGMLCAVMLAAFISTHDTYLHSWGSIFVQDVILPFRKKPFTPKQHLFLLRVSILFVAIFIFCWSLLIPQRDFILMFFALTGAIWLGGAGSVIIGGLYWKRGTTGGAYAAVSLGAFIGVTAIILEQLWPNHVYPWLAANAPQALESLRYFIEDVAGRVPGINWKVEQEKFVLNGQWINFFAMLSAIAVYVTCSMAPWLALKRPAFNMDRMLHRGAYTVKGDHAGDADAPTSAWRSMLPNKEFTFRDKCVYYSLLTLALGWSGVFVLVGLYNLVVDVPVDTWAAFWRWQVIVTIVLGIITTAWFSIGGIIDIRELFRTLGALKRDHRDDGRVIDHHNVADEPIEEDQG